MGKVTYAPRSLGAVAVPVPGTIVPLAATPTEVGNVVIQAKKTNVGPIFIGGATLVAADGIQLEPGEYISMTADTSEDDITNCVIDLQSVFVDSVNAGDEVTMTTLEEVSSVY
jgi:hypothetical protein